MGIFNFFSKKENKEDLNKGLEKTKEGVFSKLARAVAGKSKVDDEVLDNLEEVLITSDVGVDTTLRIIERIEKRVAEDKYMNTAELNGILRSEITALLEENRLEGEQAFDYGKKDGMPYVVMVVGVNGAGKTTTIGKLASKLRQAGQESLHRRGGHVPGCCDRPAGRLGRAGRCDDDPAGHGFRPRIGRFRHAAQSAVANGADVVLIDTAGRLHNKIGLMNELTKIRNVMAKVIPGAPHDGDARAGRFDGPERLRAGQAVHPSDAGHLARHHEARRYGQGRRRDRHQRPVQDTRPFHRRRAKGSTSCRLSTARSSSTVCSGSSFPPPQNTRPGIFPIRDRPQTRHAGRSTGNRTEREKTFSGSQSRRRPTILSPS